MQRDSAECGAQGRRRLDKVMYQVDDGEEDDLAEQCLLICIAGIWLPGHPGSCKIQSTGVEQVWNTALKIGDEDDDKAKQLVISSTQFSTTHFNSQVHIQYTRVEYTQPKTQVHQPIIHENLTEDIQINTV